MKSIKNSLKIINNFKKQYLVLNLIFYGFMVIGMAVTFINPNFRQALNACNSKFFSTMPVLSSLTNAYRSNNIFMAFLLTFIVNLILGAFLYITVPSLFSPFIGIALLVYRALSWGIIFSPNPFELYLLPHWLTLIIEGQAYVVTMLAAYILWIAKRRPYTVLTETQEQGYRTGFEISAMLYIIVVFLLAFSALYEAVEVIYIIPVLR